MALDSLDSLMLLSVPEDTMHTTAFSPTRKPKNSTYEMVFTQPNDIMSSYHNCYDPWELMAMGRSAIVGCKGRLLCCVHMKCL